MKLKIAKERNLLLVGDLKLKVLEGKVAIFGWEIPGDLEIEIQSLTSAPLIAIEESMIEINFGEDGYITEYPDKLIPDEWQSAVEEINKLPKGSIVLVIAGVDSGKSGFICFATNILINKNKKVAIISSDTGQSELNPPTTIGYALAESPLIHLSQLEYKSAFFVGSTSPAGLFERALLGILMMIEDARTDEPDIVLINTTGWVHGPGGRELKTTKILAVNPDYVVVMEHYPDELYYIKRILESRGIRYRAVPAAPRIRVRSREERRVLRTRYYKKEFEGSRDVVLSMDDVALIFSYLGTGIPLDAEEIFTIARALGFTPEYMEKTDDVIIIATERQISAEIIETLKKDLNKDIKVINPELMKGLIVGLLDSRARLINLGIIKRFNPADRLITVWTRADPNKIRMIALGRIKLNENLEEYEWLDPWAF